MMRPFVPAACAALFVVLCAPAQAAGEKATGENAPLDLSDAAAGSQAGGGGGIVRTVVGLAVVIGVIYGLYWVLRQVKASREERASGSGLSSLATLPLGPNRSLHLVKAGSEVIVVGVAEHGVVPIRTYSEEEARDAGLFDADVIDVEVEPARPATARLRELVAPALPAGSGGGAGVLDTLRAWTVRR